MAIDRVKFQEIVASQLPRYVREDFPLLTDFLEQYYVSQESQSGPIDIVNNIDKYVKVDELFNIVNSTTLSENLDYTETNIRVESTEGFAENNGIIKIDDEIIFYETKSKIKFLNCKRGFSGITTYITTGKPDELTFTKSEIDEHSNGTTVENLNVLFLQEFFKKLKRQVTPGFTERNLFGDLDQRNFIYGADSFYTSKGTDQSYEILFRALYGEDVEVIRPSQFLLTPSNADYKVTKDFVVEKLQGDPLQLQNLTIFQKGTNARGSVTNVEKIPYSNFQYYQISIDSGFQRDSDVNGSIFGEFRPNPLTKLLEDVGIGDTVISVDSTIDFPEFGNIVVDDIDGQEIGIAYSGKTINQFFNVVGVTNVLKKTTNVNLDSYSYAFVGIDTSQEIRVRFTSTLKDFVQDDPTFYFEKDDTIEIKSLGYEAPGKKNNNYIFNIKTKFKILDTKNLGNNTYSFSLYDDTFFKEGYEVIYQNEDFSYSVLGEVITVSSLKDVVVRFNENIDTNGIFFLENQLLKGKSSKYSIGDFVSNVQNIYSKFDGSTIIASNSIPRYIDQEIDTYGKSITFSNELSISDTISIDNFTNDSSSLSDHGFYTGDSLYVEPKGNGITGIITGTYFAFRVDASSFKLSKSKSDLFRNTYVSIGGTFENSKITLLDFYNKDIKPQAIYRKVLSPEKRNKTELTRPGKIGIFNNGLELLNYKSSESVYYGDIQEFVIKSGGSGYDIINPPILNVRDEVGVGATGVCNVLGKLERIDVTNTGLGYTEAPFISITGGNGKGATAEPRMKRIRLENSFLADFSSNVNITTNEIIFDDDHKFQDGERVIYEPGKKKIISGLSTDAEYYAFVKTQKAITLHRTMSEGMLGINTIQLQDFGSGPQVIAASELKLVVSDVIVTNPGTGYENKRRTIPADGVNTASNQIEIINHGYQSKEVIKYTVGSGVTINGLNEDNEYFVKKISNDAFSLSEVGLGSTARDFYYDNNILINFTNQGTGSFNYPPIKVEVQGLPALYDKDFVENFNDLFLIESPVDKNIITPTNVLAFTQDEAEILVDEITPTDYYVWVQNGSNWLISEDPFIGNVFLYQAEVQPVFRGSIESIDITDGGVGYGASTIIDFARQPETTFESGKEAKLTPVINNGEIKEVVINSGGSGYNSPPDLEIISDTGNFAVLVPILKDGKIESVFINKGGVGYESGKTTINVINSGSGARVQASIKAWNINLFEKNFANLQQDDCTISESIDNSSLQFASLYAPRSLRDSLNVLSGFDENNIKFGISDLSQDDGNINFHSPILGWAYDGNPIYGPYGFKFRNGSGRIVRLKSGYEINNSPDNRPSSDDFPTGIFVNDYIFTGSGDLDKSNGRFCVTPDYPNGVYAYFVSISNNKDGSGPFKNSRRPVFPYVIGNEYYSKPEEFNFKSSSNQTDFNLVEESYFRNTSFYYTNNSNSGYDYIFNSDKERNQLIDITAVSSGSVDNIEILDSGENYSINDKVKFDTTFTGGRNLDYRVTELSGKNVDNISLTSTTIEKVEFSTIDSKNGFVGLTSTPHNYKSLDTIFIDDLSSYYKNFEGSYVVGVTSERWYLSVGLGTDTVTGIVTYTYLSGPLDERVIRSNDILNIEEERVKVLNVDKISGRIRILRGIDNSLVVSHPAGTIVRDDPRKIKFTSSNISTKENLIFNRELYFDPNESLGIGTQNSGAITTITFSNPGVGKTQIQLNEKEIYIPDHRLSLNTPLLYKTNEGASIRAFSGIQGSSIYNLSDNESLFAVPLSKDIIGISSQRVGVNSVGSYVGSNSQSGGLLSFQSKSGLSNYHSFTTNIPTTLKGRTSRNVVTVSTAQTHGLQNGDRVKVNVDPTNTVTIFVKYNDRNRRIVFDPDEISESNVDIVNDTFKVPENKYKTGDKIIYNTPNNRPSENLIDSGLYYVYVLRNDTIKLVENKFELTKENPTFVNVGSAKTATLSRINPPIDIQKNQTLKFDLSDSSLSFRKGGFDFSAYELLLFTDPEKNNEFVTTKTTSNFEVIRSGSVGLTENASLSLSVGENIPQKLYYSFNPINLDNIPDKKLKIYEDVDVPNNNSINLVHNKFDGTYTISNITNNTFDYNIPFNPDNNNSFNKNVTYTTVSKNTTGPISKLNGFNKGIGFKSLPGFSSVMSETGSGALLRPSSNTIGKVLSTKFNNIGFGYPSDKTLNVIANLPQVLLVTPLGKFDSIGVNSAGINYSQAPNLIVLDGLTNEQIDVDLDYNLGDDQVRIIKNTNSLNLTPPTFIPTNNTNGFSISSVSYDENTKIVRLGFKNQFSKESDWPFVVGESVLVENIAIGLGTTGKGYNSEDYEYSLFEIKSLDPNLGGNGAYIEYDLTTFLENGEIPGNVTTFESGTVVPERFFPIFEASIKTSPFFKGEIVTNPSGVGIIERFDPISGFLYVQSDKDFEKGSTIISQGSGNAGVVKDLIDFNSTIKLGVGATFISGWQKNSGFLNDSLQVIPNNEYYQNFSYSLKSKISYDRWDDPVSSLSHISGFEKFGDLVVENTAVGIVTVAEIDVVSVVSVIGEESLYCFYDFDGATERTSNISDGKIVSTNIVLENKILIDFFESRGNRVLKIDDFSEEFNSNARETKFSVVDTFDNKYAWNKIFTLVQDSELRNRKQFSAVTVIQDGSNGYVNEYGSIESNIALGSFDYDRQNDDQWDLTFFPNNFKFNNYDISYFSFSGVESVTGVGNTTLGDIISIGSSSLVVPVNTETTLVQIDSAHRSAKVHIQLEDAENNYFYTELNILHDDSGKVELLQYGDINTAPGVTSGFGTFGANTVGSNIDVKFTPIVGTAITANVLVIEVHNQNNNVGSQSLEVSNLESYYLSIFQHSNPVAQTIASYSDPFSSGYFLVTIEDVTNDEYEMFECHLVDSDTLNIVKYGQVLSNCCGLGTVGASVSGSQVNLEFTPNPNTSVNVITFGITLKNYDNIVGINSISDLNNNILFSDYGNYTGTEFDKKTAFELKNNNFPIFERIFNGSDSSVVNTTSNQVTINNHYFVTGEKVNYSYENSESSSANAINIAPTNISGVTTDKLPTEVFIVKISDSKIGFAVSATDALFSSPNLIDITSVGIGTDHKITSQKQNTKSLVAIDNLIQAPLTEVNVSTTLDENIIFDNIFNVVGVQSFKANDLIKIDDEFMLIQDIGVESTNSFRVLRGQLGTKVETHSNGANIELMGGDYNILGNIIHFTSAPFGKTPIGTTTGSPDDRDYIGITTNSSFQGRTFLRSGIENETFDTYFTNYTFDNIQSQFNGQERNFTLLSNGNTVTGFSTQQAIIINSNIIQEPKGTQETIGDFRLVESVGITSIVYTGDNLSSEDDPNKSDVPRGGTIISLGSTNGLGYQPLIQAGATCTVRFGRIESVSIGNSGSGYRVGIQTVVNVGYVNPNTGITSIFNIGTATVQNGNIVAINIDNRGSGLKRSDPPSIVIDAPIPYSNIPLIYSEGQTGVGTGARVDITVGQGSSVIDFDLISGGFAYGIGERLTIETGGPNGIPTTSDFSDNNFEITVSDVYRDTFNGWTLGEIEVFDKLNNKFDGIERKFPLTIAGKPFAIVAVKGSGIVLSQNLIVTINDILQVPGEAYKFTGGGDIEFTEPPKEGDTSKILFYKGTPNVDVVLVDVLETVKPGDSLQLNNDIERGQSIALSQDPRTVTGITTLDTTNTFPYINPGVTTDQTIVRPVTWCKQTTDISIDGKFVTKDRVSQEPSIFPSAYITSFVGLSSNFVYVDTLRPLFNFNRETILIDYQDKINITDQSEIVPATANVSIAGSEVAAISITNNGIGYSNLISPSVSISEPDDKVGGTRATASATVVGNQLFSISIDNVGAGYTQDPLIIVEQPSLRRETIEVNSYRGDQGQIVGFAKSANDLLTIELYIPQDSFVRSANNVGTAITISQIEENDVFVINRSNFSLLSNDTADGIYRATKAYDFEKDLSNVGLGTTTIRRVEFLVSGSSGNGSFNNARIYGEYSYGKIEFINRVSSTALEFSPQPYAGITTSPIVQRFNPLKFDNYIL